jgi:hypothetical protein
MYIKLRILKIYKKQELITDELTLAVRNTNYKLYF